MPKTEEEIRQDPGVKVRAPDGKVTEVATQHAADILCDKHGHVDIAKEKAAKEKAERERIAAERAAEKKKAAEKAAA